MSDIWFEEPLAPTEESVAEVTRAFRSPAERALADAEIERNARGVVRVHTPRWQRIADVSKLLTADRASAFFQVRLGFEFDLPKEARDAGAQFVFAQCEAHLWAVSSRAQPSVYDLYPKDLYEGKPQEVSVEFGPELKVGAASGSLGKISSDVRVGQVEPVVVGWMGDEQREPRWELRPDSKSLLGVRHLWLLVESPEECSGARLAFRVLGDIQTRLGPIPVGPKERVWDERPSVVIR